MRYYFYLCHLLFIPTILMLFVLDYNLLWYIPSLLLCFGLAMYGFSIGMHHTFSHDTFKFNRPTEIALIFTSFYAMLQSPITWSTVHKAHHKHADQKGDPHSPVDLGWKAIFPWNHALGYEKPPKKLLEDPVQKFVHRNNWLLLLHPFLASLGGLESFIFLYMVPVSYILLLQLLFVLLSHAGSKNQQGNYAKNSLILTILCYGDGNHEDHHLTNNCPKIHRWFANLIGNKNVRTDAG